MTIMEQLKPNLEQRENAAELWNSPDVVTISFRRHSRWNDRDQDSKTFGALESQGIKEAKEAARGWHNKVPEGADISIYESPSFAERQEKQSPGQRKVEPMRATITASIYEKEAFGNLAPSIDTDAGPIPTMSSRRNRRHTLGDPMTHVPNRELIPSFFKEVSETYGQEMYKFWKDLVFGDLKPELKKALADIGGLDNLDMARNMMTFLKESSGELKSKNEDSKKEVAIALTHWETMSSFIALLDRYLESKGETPTQALYKEVKRGYNEGFDAHIKGDKLIVEREGVLLAEVDLDEVGSFLDKLEAEDKKGKNTKQ